MGTSLLPIGLRKKKLLNAYFYPNTFKSVSHLPIATFRTVCDFNMAYGNQIWICSIISCHRGLSRPAFNASLSTRTHFPTRRSGIAPNMETGCYLFSPDETFYGSNTSTGIPLVISMYDDHTGNLCEQQQHTEPSCVLDGAGCLCCSCFCDGAVWTSCLESEWNMRSIRSRLYFRFL